jgi:CheY-like chemotaxis protein
MEATENIAALHIHVEIAPVKEKGVLYVATRISDNGPSIPEADMHKMWVSFYTTKGAKHPGLGLPACVQILKQIDGKIAARNLPEGGVVFELLVPASVGTETESAARLPVGKRFLLVDDDDVWSRFVEGVLVEAQNTVTRTVSGDIDYADFDGIIVDEVLQAADTAAILKGIAKAGAAGKTLVVASSVRVERMMELLRFGVRDVLIKPYTRAALAEKLS